MLVLNLILVSILVAPADCSLAQSFIYQAQGADLVALCVVRHKALPRFELDILESFKGNSPITRILVWSQSDCHTEFGEIHGSMGDTVFVALEALTQDDTCDTFSYSLVAKAVPASFRTTICGTNSLEVSGGIVTGLITKPCGHLTKPGTGERYWVSYQEAAEAIPIEQFRQMLVESLRQ